jgi:signal peptidase I
MITFERVMLVVGWLILLCVLMLGYNGGVMNITDSAPIGLYVKVPGMPKRGDLMLLRPLIKRLVGVPGDQIRTSPEGTYVNGKLVKDSAIPANIHGWQPQPYGVRTLQPSQYWVLGTGNSLDSKFWGPVSSDDLATPIAPLWTAKAGK